VAFSPGANLNIPGFFQNFDPIKAFCFSSPRS
jgi:hypothetical protein